MRKIALQKKVRLTIGVVRKPKRGITQKCLFDLKIETELRSRDLTNFILSLPGFGAVTYILIYIWKLIKKIIYYSISIFTYHSMVFCVIQNGNVVS